MFLIDNVIDAVENKIGGAVASKLGGGVTADQKRRDAEIQSDYAKAVGGDVATAMSILDGRFHSIAYSKALCEKAWAQLLVDNPPVAKAALEEYQQRDPTNTSPSVASRIKSELTSLLNKIKQDVGTTVQNIGSGATTAAAQKIDPNTGRVTLPLSSSMIWTVAIVAIAIAAVFFLTRKHKA